MFQDISKILPHSIKNSGFFKQIETAQVIDAFNRLKDDILPGHISPKVKAVYIKNKTLYAASLSSIITQELTFKESDIIKEINGSFGREVITKIRFMA
jgi:hypothetical protein